MARLSNGSTEIDVPDGTSLNDPRFLAVLEVVGVAFACGVGGYGCCRVKVLEGYENLEASDPECGINGCYHESVGDGFILPCCVRIKGGTVRIDSDPRFRFFEADE